MPDKSTTTSSSSSSSSLASPEEMRPKEPYPDVNASDPSSSSRATLWGRRDFFSISGLVALIASGLVACIGALCSLFPTRARHSSTLLGGRVSDYVTESVTAITDGSERIFVIRSTDSIVALSARCPHLGCTLRYEATGPRFHCMCHGSTFSTDGDVTLGPAARSMERVQIRQLPNERIEIDPLRRYRKERGEWQRSESFIPLFDKHKKPSG